MNTIYNIHNGCESNLYDSEKSKLDFLKRGYAKAETKEDADVILFHSCTFSQEKEDESNRIINDLVAKGKKVIVSGCYLSEIENLNSVEYIRHEDLEKRFGGFDHDLKLLEAHQKKNGMDYNYPFVQISKGCYGSCTFCSIKQVKGVHKSRSVEDILYDIEVRKEFSGIKLVGEEVAGYGRDIGLTLQDLILIIVEHYPNLKIKMGSLNAKMLKVFTDNELKIFSHPNISGNVHIPIQSASTSVLSAMKRGYSIEEYVTIYNTLKSIGVKNISGDIIIGFPNETKADHQLNLTMMESYDFNFMEVFIYQERPGTKAAAMKQIDYPIRKMRATEILASYLDRYSASKNIPLQQLMRGQPIFNTNFNFI